MKYMKRAIAACLAVLTIGMMTMGCSNNGSVNQLAEAPSNGQQIATIKVKDYGDIKIMLYPEVAPKAVENFVTHAQNGYYDGLKFHRVVQDFVIQGGDPAGDGTGGESIWGNAFETEYDGRLHHYTGALAYANAGKDTNGSQFFIVDAPSPGTVDDMKAVNASYKEQLDAYKKQNPDVQIDDTLPYPTDDKVLENYANVGGTPSLDNGTFTVFGQVYEGLDVVTKIMGCEKSDRDLGGGQMENSLPVEDVIIETIEIGTYSVE